MKSILQSESRCGTLASHKGRVSTKETPGDSLPCLLCHVSTVKKKRSMSLVNRLWTGRHLDLDAPWSVTVICSSPHRLKWVSSLIFAYVMILSGVYSQPLGHCSPPQLQVSSISKKPLPTPVLSSMQALVFFLTHTDSHHLKHNTRQ